MRVLSLVTLLAFVSAQLIAANADQTGIAAVDSNTALLPRVLAAEYKQVKRSLRRYDPDEFDERDSEEDEADSDEEEDSEDDGVDSEEEERGMIIPGIEKMDDVAFKVTKSDDMVSKAAKAEGFVERAGKGAPKWKALMQKNMDELAETGKLVKKLKASDLYKDIALEKMSLSALRQLDDIEVMRADDILHGVKGTKETPDGMRRKMVHTENMKLPPAQFLVSHIGRDAQRLGTNNQRLLSAAVVSKGDDINGKVLLISSSNPKKGDFLLPKGGWDKGETVEKAALREVIEEGGVKGQLLHNLGDFKFNDGSTAYAYRMKTIEKYDDWPESIRYRFWVSFDDAITMLAKRPYMADVVKKAKEMDKKKADEALAKIKLF